jgi:hypothetical protein
VGLLPPINLAVLFLNGKVIPCPEKEPRTPARRLTLDNRALFIKSLAAGRLAGASWGTNCPNHSGPLGLRFPGLRHVVTEAAGRQMPLAHLSYAKGGSGITIVPQRAFFVGSPG